MQALLTLPALYEGVQEWNHFFSHMALKTLCEEVVEGMGSVIDRHATSFRGNIGQRRYSTEAMIHWNGPSPNDCEPYLARALDRHFAKHNSRQAGRWNFTPMDSNASLTRYQNFSVSETLDRLQKELVSKFSFLV